MNVTTRAMCNEQPIAEGKRHFQNEEKENESAETILASIEFAFENNDNQERAAALIVANNELLLDFYEKGKRAAEILMANKDLIYQHIGKAKRAAELFNADNVLYFQNRENELLTAELIIANEELATQNMEKEKRVAALGAVDKELESFSYSVSHEFKANLLNTIGQAAIATDANGIVNYWNRAAEKIYGWTKEEALGKYIIDLTSSEATVEQAIQIMESLKKGKAWSGEFKVRKKDGTDFPAFVTNSPVYNELNILSGIIGISSDITEKKQLEELLEKTNRLAGIGSWEIDVDKGTIFWSDITKEIREVDNDYAPLLNEGLSYFKTDPDKEIISQKVKECIENGTAWDEELQIITFKGNHKWVRTIGEGEFLNGKCLRIHGSFQDIDIRKKAELEILKAYEEKNIILESIGDAFFAVDKKSIITYWNNKAEIIIGKNRAEVIGKNIWTVFDGLLDRISYTHYQAAIIENREQHFETFSERLNKWLEVSAYPSDSGLTGYFKDITERKKSETAIRNSNERYNMIAKATNDSIWEWDLITNAVTRIDKTLENILGYENVQPADVDAFWKTHVHPEDWKKLTSERTLLIEDPEKNYWEDEYRFLKPDGSYAYVNDRGFILRDNKRKAIKIIGASRDITKSHENELQLLTINNRLQENIKDLATSNRELEQFAYVASHDLQEPLRMVTSFLAQLEKKYGSVIDDKGKRYIHFATDGARRMRQIILDLLEFSKVGRTNIRIEAVDLNITMQEVLQTLDGRIQEKEASIIFSQLPVINTANTPLKQVFQNLISNSLKYSRQGVPPQIKVAAADEITHWHLTVADNGIGIAAEYHEKIFVIFQRLHGKDQYSGTGIGLAITKKIIENIGGEIWVMSEEGKGSTFHFTIPK